ncbi:unnamed protein product [Microthlaspi erraticum]|uniref:Reverse transcriptase domain-containing protein n=1 Tax=Microthlaspi erraticum TaxID=1685480 RepID=A0A6D2JXW7_9BRAS|nr:unnamed protein product [Microthlaspi erraticum]
MDQLADELLEELSTEDPLQVALTKDSSEGYASLRSHGSELDQELDRVESNKRTRSSWGLRCKEQAQGDWSELKAPKVDLKPLPEGLRKAIGYTLDDIKGISPDLCIHRIHLEDESKSSIEPQRRLNPNLKEVVKKEILKLLDAGIIYPISDSTWISPVHCVPKKGGITVIKNDKEELIPTRTIVGHRMCIDYRKLNSASRKDHFPLPFIDQMLERLANHLFIVFLMATVVSSKSRSTLMIRRRPLSHALMAPLLIEGCHLGCAMLQLLSRGA